MYTLIPAHAYLTQFPCQGIPPGASSREENIPPTFGYVRNPGKWFRSRKGSRI